MARDSIFSLHGPISPRHLVFHHFPKCAGTSLHTELSSYFPQFRICPERWSNLPKYTQEQLWSWEYFSGHFDKHNIDVIPGTKTVITFLRDPKARLVSLYNFQRSHTMSFIEQFGLTSYRYAKELPMLDFFRSDLMDIKLQTDNVYARSLIGQHSADTYCSLRASDHEFIADWAVSNLTRYNFVGFTETMRDDLVRLRTLLGLEMDRPVAHLNTIMDMGSHPVREPIELQEVTPEIHRELDRLTCIDQLIYQRALAMRDQLGAPFPW